MSLFNLIFIRSLFQGDLSLLKSLKFNDKRLLVTYNQNPVKSKTSLGNVLLVNNDVTINPQLENLANKKLVSRNFITRLVNQYWQETIFISPSSRLSEHYTGQLKSEGITISKNEYKKFLFDFSKALVNGRIQTSLDQSKDASTFNAQNVVDLRYIWRKGLNFSSVDNFFSCIFKSKKTTFPDQVQTKLINQLTLKKLPIFTVINNLNQIIIAEPAEELISSRNIIDNLYHFYNDVFGLNIDQKNIYEGLFFINPEDAIEYKEYIKQKYCIYNKQNKLHIFTTSLNFYYRFIRLLPSKVKFYLIPDLKELGELVYKYKYLSNVVFHKKQKYGTKLFQGQPIYLIQPIQARNKATKQLELINYTYEFDKGNSSDYYQAVFMNYNVALKAWKQFIQKMDSYHLPNKPKILVYNLESFLLDSENSLETDQKKIVFIPTEASYQFIKKSNLHRPKNTVYQKVINKAVYCKLVSQRILWSLTSRQPVNW